MTDIARGDAPEDKEGSGKAPVPTPRRSINLRDVEAIKRELAKVYSEARRGQLDPGAASKLAYLLGMAAKLVEQGDTERRLEELEARLAALAR